MDAKIISTLKTLEERSRAESVLLAELNARGARHVREAASSLMLDVGPQVGALLNVLARSCNAKRIVEIGGSVGYSTLFLAEAARATGGRVISLEIDAGKQREQRSNLERSGLLQYVDLVLGDSAEILPTLDGPLDLILIDHWKDLYIRDFDLVWPNLAPRGIIVADNILHPEATVPQMQAYVKHVGNTPAATSYTLALGNGVEVTMRS